MCVGDFVELQRDHNVVPPDKLTAHFALSPVQQFSACT